MCDTRLTSFTVSLLIDVTLCSNEELNVLSYFFANPCFSVIFVTDGHTVVQKMLTGCGDLASWNFFMGVSMIITSDWVFVQVITTLC